MENAMPRSCGGKQGDREHMLVSVYSIYLCVIYVQVCLCGLLMLTPWAVFLMHSESCAESRTHFSSVSFSQMAFKWKLWNLCDGKMYSVCKH